MSRRSFGSVAQLPSKRWRARYRLNGVWYNAPTTFPSKTAASRWLAGVEADIARGVWADPRSGDITVREFAARWRAGRANLSPNTRYNDRYLLDQLILPTFGDIRLSKVTREAVRQWRNELLDRVGPNTAAKAYRKLRAVLADANVVPNPATIRGAGQEFYGPRLVATPDQVAALSVCVPARYEAMVFLGAYGGMRFSECSGLHRGQCDGREVTIAAQDAETAGRHHRRRPKGSGERLVILPAVAADVLADHLDQFVGSDFDALVFTSPTGRHLYAANWRRYVWYPALDTVGLPRDFRFHDLRHTGATLAARQGVPIRDLQAHLGHASARTAIRYQHAATGAPVVAAALDAIAIRGTRVSPAANNSDNS